MIPKTLTFEDWLKHKELDSKTLKGIDLITVKKEYNIYKLRAEKVVDKIVNK